ncbi:bifunctional molybdenum cofactor guanylyltransferase MobA/molybdopterin-guanine dinucleotide biosynthesis adaptor protein MobB [Chlorobium sp. N1]|uniref:bifunctional molybdenum cofactor guanylyltransferase MobA/molybdopterin-guanine dinucleotide biosynthesis adaptor protein MobB n=1 Tax=Chlorobium sp. N1 TaxID=2491138 RepID=UPI00103A404A|nr:bifunctional molybdenum cofactor guanylyltransferase MobA/molybdopterin-guanine dinucleotide biosynthesis adaptor protein MobB [Chlorobium sp. N1]TCD47725.1 bifunctional molybdenum cofactor guanylyltransferase MobA/molybdopterin-guanine dinucleotide biosynthesis adaptor protein MobB [Chlorobium sp. N1]
MLFHPSELAFCGYSGSGKTTLATAVVRDLAARHRVGYYKHGCHRFDIDREGKDSDLAARAGAATVMVSGPDKKAAISHAPPEPMEFERFAFRSCDMLIVEGLKELPIPKIVLVDSGRKILRLIEEGSVGEVLALAVPDDPSSYRTPFLEGVPVLHRDDTRAVADFVERHLLGRAAPLAGLVLAGGRSSRMGCDKALLDYHGKNQLEYARELLAPFCREVCISCRSEQAEEYAASGMPIITDSYLDMGPMGGLLSAQRALPGRAFLVLACDLPFLDCDTLGRLAAGRNPLRFATAWRSPRSGRFEPLPACYEPKSGTPLLLRHAEGLNGLSDFLSNVPIEELEAPDALFMQNINTPGERSVAQQAFSERKNRRQ